VQNYLQGFDINVTMVLIIGIFFGNLDISSMQIFFKETLNEMTMVENNTF
jgi:hypothetical protein